MYKVSETASRANLSKAGATYAKDGCPTSKTEVNIPRHRITVVNEMDKFLQCSRFIHS